MKLIEKAEDEPRRENKAENKRLESRKGKEGVWGNFARERKKYLNELCEERKRKIKGQRAQKQILTFPTQFFLLSPILFYYILLLFILNMIFVFLQQLTINYTTNLIMKSNKKQWSQEEDIELIKLVKIHRKNWAEISQELNIAFKNNRGVQQCKQRYMNNHAPDVNRNQWSTEEIKLIFEEHRRYGNQWTTITQKLPTKRTHIAVKNQFFSAIRRALRRINKFLGGRHCTEQVNSIKPKDLANLLTNLEQESLYQILFDFSNNEKYEDLKGMSDEEHYRQKLQRIIQKALIKTEKPSSKMKNKQFLEDQMSGQEEEIQEKKQETLEPSPSKQKQKPFQHVADTILNKEIQLSEQLSEQDSEQNKDKEMYDIEDEYTKKVGIENLKLIKMESSDDKRSRSYPFGNSENNTFKSILQDSEKYDRKYIDMLEQNIELTGSNQLAFEGVQSPELLLANEFNSSLKL